MTAGAQIDQRTGAGAVVGELTRLGVEIAFGLPGVHNLALWRELRGGPIRLVGVRHEQAAAYAADGYARASGRLGVALVTSGPGAANTLAAVGEAAASRSPVLVIATDVPAALRRPGVVRGLLHESRDQRALFTPLVKAAIEVAEPGEIAAAVGRAAAIALAAPAGPVYLGIPADLLDARAGDAIGGDWEPRVSITGHAGGSLSFPPPVAADRAVAQAAALLSRAARPLIWAGGGAVHAGAGPALARLAERLAAPVVTTYQGRGILPPEHPCVVSGPVHAPEVGALWDEADVVLAVGSDLDAMMTQNWRMPRPPALIAVNVDSADAAKNWTPDVMVVADALVAIEAILTSLEGAGAQAGTGEPRATRSQAQGTRGEDPETSCDQGGPPLSALAARLRIIGEAVRARVAADEPQAPVFLDALRDGLPRDAVLVADMCIPGYWVAGFHPVPAPRRLAYPVGWGTLGFAFPAALGTALAHDGPTVCVCGDGGFLMACGELATAAQEQIPLTILLFDDGGYGMLRFDQGRAGAAHFGVDLASPDFAALAGSFGVDAQRVTLDGLREALEEHAGRAEPTMIVVQAALRPPPTTSPRWYRAAAGPAGPADSTDSAEPPARPRPVAPQPTSHSPETEPA